MYKTKLSIEKSLREAFGSKKFFSRQELYDLYKKSEPELNESTFGIRVHRLKEQNIIRVLRTGIYSLSQKHTYLPPVEERLEKIYREITAKYPYLNLCVWNTRWMNDFMIHQAGRFIWFVEVEPEGAESIFYFLRDNGYSNTYLQPDEKIMSQYVYQETETIIVKSLISKSPLQKSNNVAIPRLEKILVDIFCEKIQLSSFRGEMENIFKTAYEQFDINFSVLLNYANRRGKKKELIEYMKQNTITPEGLFT
ncbi:MAG: hypothetical protein HYU69_02895 [Bacteroidetes bacterium]|nr:hypothetical protein [Bacteroidota bacterium]